MKCAPIILAIRVAPPTHSGVGRYCNDPRDGRVLDLASGGLVGSAGRVANGGSELAGDLDISGTLPAGHDCLERRGAADPGCVPDPRRAPGATTARR